MGICQEIAAKLKKEADVRVAFPRQDRVAVDLLIPLMKWLQSTDVAANMFHRKPEVPLFYPLYKMLKRLNDMLIHSNLIPIYVLDGAREDIKGEEHLRRVAQRTKMLEKLNEIWIDCDDEEYDASKVMSLKKQTSWFDQTLSILL